MTTLKSLKKDLLSNQVQEALIKALIRDGLKPGDKLPSERELAEQFQVSRATVREALNQMRRAGFTETRRGLYAGSYIAEPCSRLIAENFQSLVAFGVVDYAHLIDARLHFEPEIARTAALCASETEVQGLTELLDNVERLSETSCKEARLMNVRFHYEVAQITKNQIIIFITEAITQVHSGILIEVTRESLSRNEVLRLVAEHRLILDRIAARDGEGAAEMARRHLIETFSMYTQIFPEKSHGWITEKLRLFSDMNLSPGRSEDRVKGCL
jgi:DNA-binding FadR family transcriptional regulator